MDYKFVNTEGLPIIGKGVTATVYKLDEKRVLKSFIATVKKAAIIKEYEQARAICDLGVKTPQAYELVQCQDNLGIVYARMDGVTMAEYIVEHQENLLQEGKRYGQLVREMNSIKVPEGLLPNAIDFLEKTVDGQQDRLEQEEIAVLKALLAKLPKAQAFLHGDIAPVNIMLHEGEWYAIDLPTAMTGHPVYELLQPYTYCHVTNGFYESYLAMSEAEQATSLGQYLGRFKARYLASDKAEEVWQGFLEGYFGEITEAEKLNVERLMKLYNAIKWMVAGCMAGKFSEGVIQYLIAYGRRDLQENIAYLEELNFDIFTKILEKKGV